MSNNVLSKIDDSKALNISQTVIILPIKKYCYEKTKTRK